MGTVEHMPVRKKSGRIKVSIEYHDAVYTVRRPGYHFTPERRMRARESNYLMQGWSR